MAKDVAGYLIYLSYRDGGDGLTNLKLQKLLYYAQGFHLAIEGVTLFDDGIEAWTHGPVVRDVYMTYNRYGYDVIDRVWGNDGRGLAAVQRDIVKDVWLVFREYSARLLEELVRSEDPWLSARGSLGEYDASTSLIDVGELSDFIKAEYVQ